MIDIDEKELQIGDLLLNLRYPEIDPFDAWAHLVVVPYYGDMAIRDLNAWNQGWVPKETRLIGNYKDHPDILKYNNMSVAGMTASLEYENRMEKEWRRWNRS